MARVTYVKKAQQRYETVPVIDPETGEQKKVPVLRADGTPKKTKSGRPVVMGLTVKDETKPLPNRKCEKCGQEIKVGDPYKWIKPAAYRGARGYKRIRCATCPSWRPSETTSSEALGTLYAAQEAAQDAIAAWSPEEGLDAAQSILEALAEGVREAAAVYEQSADNMESGFGGETSVSQEIREKQETLESAADEIDQYDLPEAWDEDEKRAEILTENGADDDYDWDEDPDGLQGTYDEALEEWGDEVRSAVEEAIDQTQV